MHVRTAAQGRRCGAVCSPGPAAEYDAGHAERGSENRKGISASKGIHVQVLLHEARYCRQMKTVCIADEDCAHDTEVYTAGLTPFKRFPQPTDSCPACHEGTPAAVLVLAAAAELSTGCAPLACMFSYLVVVSYFTAPQASLLTYYNPSTVLQHAAPAATAGQHNCGWIQLPTTSRSQGCCAITAAYN